SVSLKTGAIGSASGFSETDLGGNLRVQPVTNLLLGTLAKNGGPTQTMLPAVNSPLVGHGSNPWGAVADQRGLGFPRFVDGIVDIGAVQVNDLVVHNANNSGVGSFRQVIDNANLLAGADTVTFDPTFFNVPRTIALTTGEL